MTRHSERSGALILRAWLEGGAGLGLRARITQSRNLVDFEHFVTTTTSVDEIITTVRDWLDALAHGAEVEGLAGNGSTPGTSAGAPTTSPPAASTPSASPDRAPSRGEVQTTDASGSPATIAADGSEVRTMIRGVGGDLAHVTLSAGHVSVPVRHATSEQLRYVVGGEGELWRRNPAARGVGSVVSIRSGIAVNIPPRTDFQFRSFGSEPLSMVSVSVRRGRDDPDTTGGQDTHRTDGPWTSTVAAGPGSTEH